MTVSCRQQILTVQSCYHSSLQFVYCAEWGAFYHTTTASCLLVQW